MMFKYPWLLLALLIIVPLVAWYVWKWRNSNPSLGISTTGAFGKYAATGKVMLMHFAFALQIVAIACIIVALARPQTSHHKYLFWSVS